MNKLKQLRSSKGFTIVELLIVIIVIAILATLVITAYNGVQAKARDVKRQSDANEVQKAAESYNADNGSYPTVTANFRASGNTIKLDSSITIGATAPSSSSPDIIQVKQCGSGAGDQIIYYSEQSSSTTTLTAGDTSGTCTAVAS